MNPGIFLINGIVVRPEERVTLLGVHIDNKLNFGHHVSHICQKAGKQVKVLGRLSRVLDFCKLFREMIKRKIPPLVIRLIMETSRGTLWGGIISVSDLYEI